MGEINGSDLAMFAPVGSPVVTNQPQSQTVPLGQMITLRVNATGQGPLAYQWRRNEVNLPEATNSVLIIPNVQPQDAGFYRVVVTNRVGLVNSATASIVVTDPPRFTAQSQSQTVAPGANVTLSVNGNGSPPPRIQWRRNGVNIPGAIDPTLNITNVQPTDGGSYSVVIANAVGLLESGIITLIVTSPSLPFADNLRDRTVTNLVIGLGSGGNTNATREANEPLHAGKISGKSVWYAWRAPANGVATFHTRGSTFDTLLAVYTNAPAGARTAESASLLGLERASADKAVRAPVLTLVAVASDDDRGGFLASEVVFNAVTGTEYLIALDGFGRSSGHIVLSWRLEPLVEVPRIFQPPFSQTTGLGENTILSVTAFSARPLAYQWYFNCLPITGATNATLTLTNMQAAQVGNYSMHVTSGGWTLESLPAFVQIQVGGTAQKTAGRDKLGELVDLSSPGVALLSVEVNSALRTPHSAFKLGGSVARGYSGAHVFNTFGAAKEIGEPNHCGEPGGRSYWFKLVNQDEGHLLVSTEGSDFDTVLAVYAGPEAALGFEELTFVTCDNSSGLDAQSSRVMLPARARQAYYMAVDGVNGASGRVGLSYQWSRTPFVTVTPVGAVLAGSTVSLNVPAISPSLLGYQWRLNGVALKGQTNPALALVNVQPAQAGRYSCVVNDRATGTFSVEVTVNVVSDPLRVIGGAWRSDGTFAVKVGGLGASQSVIETSTNLVEWLPIFTNRSGSESGLIEVIDDWAAHHPLRFYRARR